ncbi:hypothetical protein BDM02DRAFT_2706851 [Thelephora ganbajun]|uniref:Uncharacterized protein n=1 Tax=Thelephora ganbajun TaxID=370292 RepID=A0ACB6ZCT3_THEGA|nr:hypothetical protein BDM02DRAFT_2706851 [Thelephora ganbajun]
MVCNYQSTIPLSRVLLHASWKSQRSFSLFHCNVARVLPPVTLRPENLFEGTFGPPGVLVVGLPTNPWIFTNPLYGRLTCQEEYDRTIRVVVFNRSPTGLYLPRGRPDQVVWTSQLHVSTRVSLCPTSCNHMAGNQASSALDRSGQVGFSRMERKARKLPQNPTKLTVYAIVEGGLSGRLCRWLLLGCNNRHAGRCRSCQCFGRDYYYPSIPTNCQVC